MNQVFTDPLQWIPKPILWSNYVDALTKPTFPYLRLLANTIFYAVSTTVGAIIASSLAAYAFARMDFWGKNVLFLATLSVMMLPAVVTLIPMYVLYRHLGWTGTWAPLDRAGVPRLRLLHLPAAAVLHDRSVGSH